MIEERDTPSYMEGSYGPKHACRFLYEHSSVAFYQSTLKGQILDCNKSFCKIIGFASKNEALKTRARDLYVRPADRDEIIAVSYTHLRAHET